MYYYPIILISLIFAAIYDYRTRYINDVIWIPSVIATIIFVVTIPDLFLQITSRILLIFVVGSILAYLKFIGQADVIAFIFAFSDSYSLASPITFMFILLCVIFINFVYVSQKFKSTIISISEFRRKPHWIPVNFNNVPLYRNINNRRDILFDVTNRDTKISVVYGHPFVLYIAESYIIYLIYLILFQYKFIVQTP